MKENNAFSMIGEEGPYDLDISTLIFLLKLINRLILFTIVNFGIPKFHSNDFGIPKFHSDEIAHFYTKQV